jgi:serine protease AprX
MITKLLAFTLLLGSLSFASETGHDWVFFNDRPCMSPQEQSDFLHDLALNMEPHRKARRMKSMPAPFVSDLDLPLCEDYISRILESGALLRQKSRWLNAISIDTSHLEPETKASLRELDFVREMRPVAAGRRILPPIGEDQRVGSNSREDERPETRLSYGASFDQLEQLGVIDAHEAGLTGAGVRVLMLDTGYYKSHEAIPNAQILAEWDFVNGDDDTQNEAGDLGSQHDHGTYTLTTLGGLAEGTHYGPAYGSSFLLAKTEDVGSETPVEEDNYVAGLEWGEFQGADVASASLGYLDWYEWADMDGQTAITTIGVNTAISMGMICCNAAGNERGSAWNHIIAPADAFDVITVGAVDTGGNLASFSSPGPSFDGRMKPEVTACGVNTACAGTSSTTSYTQVNGTSLSTPLMGGCVALLLEAYPSTTPQRMREALMSTADNAASPDNDFGWGVVNVPAALAYLKTFQVASTQLQNDTDGDGFLERGESAHYFITLENTSTTSITNLSATLSSSHPALTLQTATTTYPDFEAGTTHANVSPFLLAVATDAPEIFTANLLLSLAGDDFTEDLSLTLQVGHREVYFTQEWESGAGDFTHHGQAGWQDQWHLSQEDSHSPTHSWKCGDSAAGNYLASMDARLQSPPIYLEPYSLLSFSHRMDAELSAAYPDSAYDGGVFEISVDDGATWFHLEADNHAQSMGYNASFRGQTGGGSPATHPFDAGRSCWSGHFDWVTSSVDLFDFAGEEARLRFRFGSDAGAQLEGWYVDDLQMSAVLAPSGPDAVDDLQLAVSGGSVDLSWTAAAGALTYRIEVTSSLGMPWTSLGETAATSFTLPLSDGVALFRVVALRP